jgi:hypothetical protein
MNIMKLTYVNYHNININDDKPKNNLNIAWLYKLKKQLQCQAINWNIKKSLVPVNYLYEYIFDNIFISKKIRLWILQNKSYNKIQYFHNKYGTINILFVNEYNIEQLEKYMMNIIQTLYEYSIKKRKVNIIIILTDFKKQLPDNKENVIDIHNVNSGMSDGKNIIIWRFEEIKKVLIHELIHHYCLDFGYMDDHSQKKYYEAKLYKNYNIINKNGIIINEGITEILATIINCITTDADDLTKLLVYETWHSFIQVSKILNHYGFKKIDEFIGLDKTDKMWRENTNIFSYYFIKSIILFNLPKIITLLNIKCKRNINNYILLLDKIRITNDYVDVINWLMQYKIKDTDLKMSYY